MRVNGNKKQCLQAKNKNVSNKTNNLDMNRKFGDTENVFQTTDEKSLLFELSNVDEEANLEELVFPSTSKVSEKLSEVLASIRRVRERNIYEATQHVNTKKDKKCGKRSKEIKTESNKKQENNAKLSKKKSSIADNCEETNEFSTNILDISITPEKEGFLSTNTSRSTNTKKTFKTTINQKGKSERAVLSSSDDETQIEPTEHVNISKYEGGNNFEDQTVLEKQNKEEKHLKLPHKNNVLIKQSDESVQFDTNILDVSITPEKECSFKKVDNLLKMDTSRTKNTQKVNKSGVSSYFDSDETKIEKSKSKEINSKFSNKKQNPSSKNQLNVSKTCSSFFINKQPTLNQEAKNVHIQKNTSLSKGTPEKNTTSLTTQEDNIKHKPYKKLQNNKDKLCTQKLPEASDISILDSKFVEVCAEGASKKGIEEKLCVFLKRKFSFQPANQNKRFKHEIIIEQIENNNESTMSQPAGLTNKDKSELTKRQDLSEDEPNKEDNAVTFSKKTSDSTTLNVSTVQSRPICDVKISAATRQKLLLFSAKTNSKKTDENLTLPTTKVDELEITNGGSNFNITKNCDLQKNRVCEDQDHSKQNPEGESQKDTALLNTNSNENSQTSSLPFSNYSQSFSLIDGEENLDDIDFDL